MKLNPSIRRPPLRLAGILLAALGVTTTALAAAPPALQGQIVARPLTPGEKTAYGLPSSLEVSGGISTVGVGTAVYLEAEINSAVPASDILSVTWALTNSPFGSVAALGSSPLGTNVPVYEPADRSVLQVASRTMLRPDLKGQYTVLATIATGSSGSTNLSFTITAGTYMGINTCFLCHSGGEIAPDKSSWQGTAHAHIFSEGIDGVAGHYGQNCLSCHTVGYDANTNAVNGGFDDIAKQVGWIFPSVFTNGNWANIQSKYPALANVANIQCENCHGPGSEHAVTALQDHELSKKFISATTKSGDCNQCHDAPTHHIKGTEWYSSAHAVTTRDPSGPGREGCVICHTSQGFIDRISGAATTNTVYGAIGCQTCHEPHGQTTPTNNMHLVRTLASASLMDGTTVTNAGMGTLCMDCHHARQNATNYVETATASSRFGPHHGPQADMLMGANGVTYGKNIPSSAHRDVVADTCVTCHMQTVDLTNSAFLHAGGHTFKLAWEGSGTNGPVELTAACNQCHGQIASFDFKRQDYDGDGIVEGVQTEVKHLLDKLGTMLPPAGTAKATINITTNWTRSQLRAGYNYLFVQEDGSFGVHNLAYAVGLLKTSIADLSGDANNDGLPDWWQTQYFGSISSPNGAPNATPANDGVPNWLKFSLGLDPTIAATAVPGGVVLANGKNLVNPPVDPSQTNGIAIYTAAEVAFNTEAGKSYQLQAISSLSEGWQNVGSPIPGTGAPVSYVTPTRNNVQQFFRVVHNP